jgi:DNA (cytosine-5)-methyltransferase 1
MISAPTPIWTRPSNEAQDVGILEAARRPYDPRAPQALSLFSGAGGLDLGVRAAGFEIGAAVELNSDAVATMRRNFPAERDRIIREDLRVVPATELIEIVGRPDLLIGGPPCTPFSKSGFWLESKRNGKDPTAELLQTYANVLRQSRPRAFILENVYALTYRNQASAPAFDRLKREISEAGYDFDWAVLNAADFGVPQSRPRVFLVGAPRGSRIPRLPSPTHGGMWERRQTGAEGHPHITAGEALHGVQSEPEREEVVRGRWAALLGEVPPGENYLHFTAKRGHPDPIFPWRGRYWSFLLKLSPDRPSPTIQAHPGPYVGPFHWDSRRLRVPELKRLFTYPEWFQFSGSRSSVQAQIGNSVPPLLAYAVGRAVLEDL